MCGITGVWQLDNTPVDPARLGRMVEAIAHRGPDAEGCYIQDAIGLGHRRLAIIDLSPAGRQPMSNEDGTIWITYNGEIYNFQEIKQELEHKGHLFRSQTDTEMIVHAYEEWGVACLNRFNGMFAFALWDGRSRQLWLVRDRLGIKPLFYAHLPGRFLFGSEIKAILANGRVPRTLDTEALSYYLALNYTPAPYTLFSAVRQLLPGHYLLVKENGTIQDVAYWDLIYHENEQRSQHDWLVAFNELLADAVRVRLMSDVPFGSFLSGGVDSSAIAYWMSQQMSEPVKTFSIGFGEDSFDELIYARQVARTIRAEAYEKMVTAETAKILPQIVWHSEEPTADSSMIAVYYLAQMARQHVTMALSGDGADEILAGYETYQAYYIHRLYRLLPAFLRSGLITPLVGRLPVSDTKVSWDYKLRRFVAAGHLTGEEAHATWRQIFDQETLVELLGDAPMANVMDLYRATFAQTNARHPLNRLLYVDTRFYLPNDMLVKVDRMTMAHGLEARVPFLDHRVVEFTASIPPSLKLKQLRHKKYLLKAAMKDRLPQEVLWRKKQGFNVPNARWVKGDLKPFVLDHLSPQRIQSMGFLNGRTVQSLLQTHFNETADNSHQIWGLLCLSLWWQQFIAGEDTC
jgi:asparagine synthase (glutamine-hydrolysing)